MSSARKDVIKLLSICFSICSFDRLNISFLRILARALLSDMTKESVSWRGCQREENWQLVGFGEWWWLRGSGRGDNERVLQQNWSVL
ncbi:unnamed protein product [Musa hybrid cultivar]